MKTSAVIRLAMLAGLVFAAVMLTLAACGGDDGGSEPNPTASAEEAAYLEALSSALQAVNVQLDDLDELRAEAFDDGPDAAAADAYGAANEVFAAERLAAIEALTPSENLARVHAALGSAASDSLLLAQELRAEIAKSPPGSEAEFLEIFGGLDGATITSRYSDVCTTLQSRAASGGLDIDLQCLR